MKFSAGIVTLASLAAAAPAVSDPKLDVKLEMQGNSKVKAVITNAGAQAVKILRTGSILDNSVPVKKASVVGANGANADFQGVRVYVPETPQAQYFSEVPAGQSIETTFDVAEVYDLANGGVFDIESIGNFRYAKNGDIANLGSINFQSNRINTHVDGAEAAQILSDMHTHQRRVSVSGDCTGSKKTAVNTGIKNTLDAANAAAKVARSGPASKMNEYFKKNDQNTRGIVAGAFEKMAKLYSSGSGSPGLYCSDSTGNCQGGVVAYTWPGNNTIHFCDAWFNSYQPLIKKCRTVDQMHIAVHEATHLSATKGTSDYSTYGYENSIKLPADKNINHADTYGYFAHDAIAGC